MDYKTFGNARDGAQDGRNAGSSEADLQAQEQEDREHHERSAGLEHEQPPEQRRDQDTPAAGDGFGSVETLETCLP